MRTALTWVNFILVRTGRISEPAERTELQGASPRQSRSGATVAQSKYGQCCRADTLPASLVKCVEKPTDNVRRGLFR
jgi:hypothetical protein